MHIRAKLFSVLFGMVVATVLFVGLALASGV